MRRPMSYLHRGQGRSTRAEEAEAEGKLPLTRATKVLAQRLGVTQKVARATLEAVGPSEWHHVGKCGQQVDYYDINDVLEELLNPQVSNLHYRAVDCGDAYVGRRSDVPAELVRRAFEAAAVLPRIEERITTVDGDEVAYFLPVTREGEGE